ncbi:MAG TPA: methylenetetrahydrofolate reductase [NAD(P)H] [Gammaproteobacteria bacterium]|nr:methylenetetrahydrofolate reductase [NAD(P)H] [Gammaproteobacteria bacterium]
MQSQKRHPQVFSCEFFPPKTDEGLQNLRATRERLALLRPRFFSVTYGAGGSTQERTFDAVREIQRESGIEAAPHLSCIGSSRAQIREILAQYQADGIRRIVALRGDLPSGSPSAGEFRYANELVEFIRAETGDRFRIEVACYPEFHPQAADAEQDLLNFKRKVEAGADAAITQFFYNLDAYLRFVESCEQLGIDIPIVPGIMPIGNFKQLARFADGTGAEIPRWLRKRMEAYGDDRESIRAFGLEVVTELCQRLLGAGAPGLHFYTMNQAALTEEIWLRLGLTERAAQQ